MLAKSRAAGEPIMHYELCIMNYELFITNCHSEPFCKTFCKISDFAKITQVFVS